ncbi:hypothetical protein H696_04802 [Fonticula alba]|uniref:RNA helicase n=1 Tax=Fonticula alba TaxID=691883 RepID=A0A058Z2P7_FONAL|nr:hypothetical protein H696_04802 [Fonticula alba]KCV68510.1 hypothetical protein H696_04802 [Fonticula alba]|eukprot:XP_009496942.1 hypothetical protein H696_04802 [Fonticula alba]
MPADMRTHVQRIFVKTPREKQTMMFTATLPDEMKTICKRFMNHPLEIYVDKESKLTLAGLRQYYVSVLDQQKVERLMGLLDHLDFSQVVIFVRSIARCKMLAELLANENFPAIAIYSTLDTQERIARYRRFKENKERILVATDLFGRGIDIEHVNIVINFDLPESSDQYLHRVGRAGRFGTKGLAIAFCDNKKEEVDLLESIQNRFEVDIEELPDHIDPSTYMVA